MQDICPLCDDDENQAREGAMTVLADILAVDLTPVFRAIEAVRTLAERDTSSRSQHAG